MSYTSVFGNSTIFPSQVSYLALALTEDTVLQWPLEAAVGSDLVANIIDVTPTGAYSIFMPDATLAAPGNAVQFCNLGPSTITIKNSVGGTLLSITAGLTWTLYLTSSATAAGTWNSYQAGASTAQAQASALAGLGIVAQGSVLSQSAPVTLFNSDFTLAAADRASVYVWNGGLGTLTLPDAGTVGNNWFVSARNGGSGNLTLAAVGSDSIDDAATLVLRPGDSVTINTDGVDFYTVGYGQEAVFAFDYTSIDLTGETTSYTLSGSELNRIAYKFVGTLTTNMEIVVPPTTQQYWVDNQTTGGSYTLGVGVSGQSPFVDVPRDSRGIYYSDGSTVVNAATAGISVPLSISDGGTGATTAGGALINLGGGATGIAVFAAATAAAARSTLSAAASGANSDITSLLASVGTSSVVGMILTNAASTTTVSATAATGTIAYYPSTQSILYYTTAASANWTTNITFSAGTTLNSALSTGQTITVAFLVTQGASPKYCSSVEIDGTTSGVTTIWQGGAPTSGNASGVDVYTFTIIKTGSGAWTVLGTLTQFKT